MPKRSRSESELGESSSPSFKTTRPFQFEASQAGSSAGASESSSTDSTPLLFPYPRTSSASVVKQTPFQQPTQVTSFSYDATHRLEFTNSALRYFVDPPRSAQLGHAYERWMQRSEDRGRIDSLLRAFCEARKGERAPMLEGIGVISWRGVMTRILTAPYEDRDGWEMNVMCVDGTLYFEEHVSEQRLQEKNNMKPHQRLQTYYGYAFESYCTSDSPGRQAAPKPGDPVGWGGDVDTNIQWCSVVRTKLGNTRIVIGGEVDCVRGRYTGQPDTFVELKTSLTIRGRHDEARFDKKLLKFYFQSFLLGVPEIVVGFRTPSGVLTRVQSLKTVQIPRMVRGKSAGWDPLICLDWGERFLGFLQGVVQNGPNGSVWRVHFVPGKGTSVEMLDDAGVEDVVGGEDRVGFLPRWYWEETKRVEDRKREIDAGAPAAPLANAGWQI